MEKCNVKSETSSRTNELTDAENKEIECKKKIRNVSAWRKNSSKKITNQIYEKLNRYDKDLLDEIDRENIIINFNEDVNHHVVTQQLVDTQQKRQSVKENQILDLEKKFKKTEANLHRLCSEMSSDEAYKQLIDKCVSFNDSGPFSSTRRQEEEAKLHYRRLPISVQKKFEEYCCRVSHKTNDEIRCMSQEIMGRLPLQTPRSRSPSPLHELRQVAEYSVLDDVPTTRRSPRRRNCHRALSASSTSSEDSDELCDAKSTELSCATVNFSDELTVAPVPSPKERPLVRMEPRRQAAKDAQLARECINSHLVQYCEEQELTEKMTNAILNEYTTARGVKNIMRGARNQDKIAMRGLILCVSEMQKIRTEMKEVRRTMGARPSPVRKQDPLETPSSNTGDTGEMQLMEYVQGNRYAIQDDALSKVNVLQQAKSDILDIFGKSSLDQNFLKKVTEPPRWKS